MFNKINSVSLSKLNNAEYASLMQRFSTSIQIASPANLGISTQQFEDFKNLVNKMSDSIGRSRSCKQTEDINLIDKKADTLVMYIFNTVRTFLKFPSPEIAMSANKLHNMLKSHKGCTKLPYRQQMEQMRSLLMDIDKGNLLLDVRKLNLESILEQLREVVVEYETLLDSRSLSQITEVQESGTQLRVKLDVVYEDICMRAFASSISNPTPETAMFISTFNKIIEECKMSLNLRSSKSSHPKELKESA